MSSDGVTRRTLGTSAASDMFSWWLSSPLSRWALSSGRLPSRSLHVEPIRGLASLFISIRAVHSA